MHPQDIIPYIDIVKIEADRFRATHKIDTEIRKNPNSHITIEYPTEVSILALDAYDYSRTRS